jgi:hypothetical protein
VAGVVAQGVFERGVPEPTRTPASGGSNNAFSLLALAISVGSKVILSGC